MKIKNSFLSTAIAASLLAGSASAQEETDTSSSFLSNLPPFMEKMYIGAGLGSAIAYTDIKQYPMGTPVVKYRTELGYGFNAFAGYKLNSLFGVEGTLNWVRLNGTKRSISQWFTSSVLQWDASLRFNIANAVSKSTVESRKFDVYLLGGIGISAFRTSRHQLTNGYSTDPVVGVEGYNSLDTEDKKRKTMEGSVMGGVGVSYRLTDNFDIYLDLKGYYLNTDKLDAIESTNNTTRDKYNYNTIGAIYHFGGAASSRSLPEDDPQSQLNEVLDKFKDTDGDGVGDYLDKDNNTPAGVRVYSDGTAIDTDGDGVADYLDQEKLSPCKDVDANGTAKDGDSDGVADCNDVEPNTKAGLQVDAKGKGIEVKNSPVGISSPVNEGGDEKGSTEGVISGLPSVFFASNSSSISYKNYSSLTQVAQFLRANKAAKLIVVGNSDKTGSSEYNKVLGQKRAQAVVDYLVKQNGVDVSRLTIVSKGSAEPISTRRNSGQDRRVDFLLGR